MRSYCLIAAILLPFLCSVPAYSQVSPKGAKATKEYWLNTKEGRSKVLDPSVDNKSRIAHEVFVKVKAAADKHPGPEPTLIVLNESGFPWARSLADGTTLLTKGAIDICLHNSLPSEGKARLAFVIGHELSHQVNGDFWHYFFYQGARPPVELTKEEQRTLSRAVKIAKESDSVRSKELKADQYGALYASQAGYDIRHVVSSDSNFFRQWALATNPGMLEGETYPSDHPESKERATAVELALTRVSENLAVFEKGVLAYGQGSWAISKSYFEEFLSAYQSREAYNNLGLVHYQMAHEEYLLFSGEEKGHSLSLVIDPDTRAVNTLPKEGRWPWSSSLRAYESPETKFDRYAKTSEGYFKQAMDRDPEYAEARNNLACVYQLTERPSLAVGELDTALSLARKQKSASTVLARYRNNRAVAYLSLGDQLNVDLSRKAKKDLEQAISLNPKYPDAMFNMAILANRSGDAKEFKRWMKKLNAIAPDSELSKQLAELTV